MTSEDSNLPQSLTDADFQAFSLDIAQARADARNSSPASPSPLSEIGATSKRCEDSEDFASTGQCSDAAVNDNARQEANQTVESTAIRQVLAQDFEAIHCNLAVAELMEHALLRAEGVLSDRGALCIKTLPYSGATAGSYFVVEPGLSPESALKRIEAQRAEPFCSGLQPAPMDEAAFWALYQRAVDYGKDKDLYQCDGLVNHELASHELASHELISHGWNSSETATPDPHCGIRLICELASQAIMARHWFSPRVVQPLDPDPPMGSDQPISRSLVLSTTQPKSQETPRDSLAVAELTVIALNGLKGEPCLEYLLDTEVFIAIHPAQRLALVGGSRHGGDLWGAIAALLSEVHYREAGLSQASANETPHISRTKRRTDSRAGSSALLLQDAVHCFKAPQAQTVPPQTVMPQTVTPQTVIQPAEKQEAARQETALFLGAPGSGKQTLAAALGDRWGRHWQRGPMLLQPLQAHRTAASHPAPLSLQPLLCGSYGNISGLSAADALHQQLTFGTVLENVPLRESSSQPRFSDLASSVPFRGAWRDSNPPSCESLGQSNEGGAVRGPVLPRAIFLLVADQAGVLPAIARLTAEQAAYYLTLGYGTDLPGWNRHQLHPAAHFKAIDRHRSVQEGLRWQACLQAEGAPEVYLLNTGWLGPSSASGRSLQQRIPASISQALVQAALAGELALANQDSGQIQTCFDPVFGWTLPLKLQQLPRRWCQPWNIWGTAQGWRSAAIALAEQFQTQMENLVAAGLPEAIAQAGPFPSTTPPKNG